MSFAVVYTFDRHSDFIRLYPIFAGFRSGLLGYLLYWTWKETDCKPPIPWLAAVLWGTNMTEFTIPMFKCLDGGMCPPSTQRLFAPLNAVPATVYMVLSFR